jgi:hypothetical protein
MVRGSESEEFGSLRPRPGIGRKRTTESETGEETWRCRVRAGTGEVRLEVDDWVVLATIFACFERFGGEIRRFSTAMAAFYAKMNDEYFLMCAIP